ncbi:uncharacterized protein F5891DRAFT_1194653 [Suillus fuscotomentosus]|uniref:Uncharacterized protein n=1 Tax=Suillus fuscotomentosus TaxID=1912939 RepID=A0AAD4HGU7_9AGAM|nr:uncharacterized protein F5891DRAFT_1194653 [Suillus fuscotomentosus]KAG1894989.1 hypothetical protein F5891DRAFT_1194653 [Suillus fuscotomentosus]
MTGRIEFNEAFEKLNATADPALVLQWAEQEAHAQASRLHDPKSMDIYEVQLDKGKSSLSSKSLSNENRQQVPTSRRGVATWLANGMTLEEIQIGLDKLQGDIERWVEAGAAFIGRGYDDGDMVSMDIGFIVDHAPSDDSDSELNDGPIGQAVSIGYHPETTVIPLPSNIGIQ